MPITICSDPLHHSYVGWSHATAQRNLNITGHMELILSMWIWFPYNPREDPLMDFKQYSTTVYTSLGIYSTKGSLFVACVAPYVNYNWSSFMYIQLYILRYGQSKRVFLFIWWQYSHRRRSNKGKPLYSNKSSHRITWCVCYTSVHHLITKRGRKKIFSPPQILSPSPSLFQGHILFLFLDHFICLT